MTPDPVAAYHALLEEDLDENLERLREGQREHRLVFGEHPLCVSLRPQLVTRERYDAAVAASNGVASALGALERALPHPH